MKTPLDLTRDDLCEACGKRTANHETDAGILCDICFKQVYPAVKHQPKPKVKGNSKMKSAILAVAILFAILPSNVRAQGINQTSLNNTGTINQMPDAMNNPANSLIKNVKSINKPEPPRPYSHGPVQPLERGGTNDSAWSGPNLIITIEEAERLAALQKLSLANSSIPLAEAARKAQEEAAVAKAANPSKTEVIAVQDANGNLVYVRKARKP